MYRITTALKKLKSLQKRIKGVAGGTSASKTISIIQILIDKAQRDPKPTLTSITSESMPHLKRGAIRDFKNIMQEHGYWDDRRWNATDFVYTYETGSVVEFFSLDMPHKVRGPRRQRLFINEANNIPLETFEQLEVRTEEEIWLDWNPVSTFWWYEDEDGGPGVKDRDDADFIVLTYKDNEGLPLSIVKTIESRKDKKNWWRVYGEGLLGEAEGRIYKGWQMIDEIPDGARLKRKGLDFGYTNDPTALIDIYVWNNAFIWDEALYRKGMSNSDIAAAIKQGDDALVVADSSEPKSIDEIVSYGVSVIPSQKGPGSVLQGIQYVQDQTIYVTKRSVHVWKEYRNYLWMTDKNGKTINEPQDFLNHCFVGDTSISTPLGIKPIRDIRVGDLVLTSRGYKKVLKRWNNGVKPVHKYSLQLDTLSIIITATPDHLIKTTRGWEQISRLQSGAEIYLNKHLEEKYIGFTPGSVTFPAGPGECIQTCGKVITEIFRRAFMFTTKTGTPGTIGSATLGSRNVTPIFPDTPKRSLRATLCGQRNFNQRASKRQGCGILRQKDWSGTRNTGKQLGLIDSTERLSAYNVGVNTRRDTLEFQNSVIQTAKLKRIDVEESRSERVYDLTVDGCHEYFANFILVHNCMDAGRYGMESLRPHDEDDIDLPDDSSLFNEGFY